MREYYGSLRQCNEYINDENHKAIVWKEHPFSFKLQNDTKHTVVVRRKSGGENLGTIETGGTIDVVCKNWWSGEVEVSREDNREINCNFIVERGCMIERGVSENILKNEEYIAPVFREGKVTLVSCKDCGPNLGVIPEYNIESLKYAADEVIFENRTAYDIIISCLGKVIQKIPKRQNEKFTKVKTKIPYYGTLYFDTEMEEIFYQSRFDERENKILRVNGCCMEFEHGEYKAYHGILGPAECEPYVRHLGINKRNHMVFEIWCNTIDYRLD